MTGDRTPGAIATAPVPPPRLPLDEAAHLALKALHDAIHHQVGSPRLSAHWRTHDRPHTHRRPAPGGTGDIEMEDRNVLTYDWAVWDFAKGDRVRILPGNGLHASGERTGTVTAIGKTLVHVKSDQSGQTWHVAPRLIQKSTELRRPSGVVNWPAEDVRIARGEAR